MTDTTPPPGSDGTPVTSEPRSPLELLWKLSREYSELSAYLESAQERKERNNAYLQGAYFLGFFYRQCQEEYRRFSELDVWRSVLQKPKRHNVMRSVLAFTMGVMGQGRDRRWNRIYKYAGGLEYLFRKEVLPDDFLRLLEERGGIDAIYAEACRDAKRSKDPSDDLGATAGELSRACGGDGATDRYPPAAQFDDANGNGDLPSGDGRHLADEGWRTSGQALFFSNDAADTPTSDLRPAKRGPLNCIDLETTLAVERFAPRLEEALYAKRLTIHAIVGDPDHRGWRQVQLVSVMTSNSLEGPWPGQATIEGDDDERP